MLERRLGEDKKIGPGQIYCIGGCNSGSGEYFGALPTTTTPLVLGKEDAVDVAGRGVAEVVGGINFGF